MNLKNYGNWAIITGASSGIGEEFSRQLAKQKFNLVLVARRKDRLITIASELKEKCKVEVLIISLDLSQPDFITTIEKETKHIDIGLLVNNAGFTISQNFLNSPIETQLQLVDVNIKAVTLLTHYFGNRMRTRGRSGIINVSSASAYLPIAGWSVYAASKAYVLSFTQALWHEFKGSEIDILALCPGATKSEFNHSESKRGMNAADVVKIGLTRLGKQPSSVTGVFNNVMVWVLKLLGTKTKVRLGSKITQSSPPQN